jgi:hypothetical protein
MNIQQVEVYVKISGDYCAFHEMGFDVVYDVTNNKKFGDMTLKKLQNFEYDANYVDYELRDAVIIDGVYYVKW